MARDVFLRVLEEHRHKTPVWCSCGWVAPREDPRPTWREHVAGEIDKLLVEVAVNRDALLYDVATGDELSDQGTPIYTIRGLVVEGGEV